MGLQEGELGASVSGGVGDGGLGGPRPTLRRKRKPERRLLLLTGWLARTIYTVERDGFALRIGGNPREATTPSDFGLFGLSAVCVG